MRDGSADGGALAAVGLADQQAVVPLRDVAGAVCRAVVDDDHLPVEPERVDAFEHLRDRRRLVVGGDQEGDAHAGRGVERATAPMTINGSTLSACRTSAAVSAADRDTP